MGPAKSVLNCPIRNPPTASERISQAILQRGSRQLLWRKCISIKPKLAVLHDRCLPYIECRIIELEIRSIRRAPTLRNAAHEGQDR